jgi:aryl-alcohol dehydrogenase-like predicted oxidoreductase
MEQMQSNLLGKTGFQISRLGLGTAEIGFAYGLGSPTLPNEDQALALLNEARERGVTFFDTANYYGLAEERIGRSGILKDPNVIVCTKCAQFLEKGEYFDAADLEAKIRAQVEGSLRALNLETLPILLLHGPSALQMKEGILTSLMQTLKSEGKIRSWGASTRGVESPLAAIEAGADILELAFSIADRRMEPVFAAAESADVGVINRSVYLKGVFAGRANLLTEDLEPLAKTVSAAEAIAQELGIPLIELALRYTLSESAIATSLVGTADISHLQAAVTSLEKGPLPADVVSTLRSLAISDPEQVDPARWPKVLGGHGR